jgi:small-conductance mechanosensitive channel
LNATFGAYSVDAQKLAISAVSAYVLQKIILLALDRVFHRKNWLRPDQHLFSYLRAPLLFTFVLVAADISVQGVQEYTRRLYIVAGVWLAIYSVKIFRIVSYVRFDSSHEDNLLARKVRTQLEFVERTINVIFIFLGLALILMTFDEVRTLGRSLIASAGIAGVVVGFAAQKSLGTFVSGFQVAFTQPIRLDDVVVIEGEWGVIEEITLTYVVVKIWDLRRLIVPINYFTDKCFQNWTRTEARLLAYVFLNFDYSINVEALRAKFSEFLNESKLWDRKVCVLQVTDSSEKSLQLRFLMSAKNSPQAFDLRCEIREKILAYVQTTQPGALPVLRLEGAERTGDRFKRFSLGVQPDLPLDPGR